MSIRQVIRFCEEHLGFIPEVITEQHFKMAADYYNATEKSQ